MISLINSLKRKRATEVSNKKTIFIKNITEKLDAVSPTMCLAKWTQSTTYLNTGHTHSCHHPSVHRIPTEGLAEHPEWIHNTPYKQSIRQQMLDGERPRECDYCWRVEDLENEHASDRFMKSSAPWSLPYYDEIVASGTGANFAPRTFEVSFETTCNFACAYCMPEISSKIYGEIQAHGPYELFTKKLHMIREDRSTTKLDLTVPGDNVYIDAFWKSIPTWWDTLHTFRITGGEPLLSKHTWLMMDYVEKNANKELTFAVNTNLGVPDVKIDQLIERVNQIAPNLKRFEVYTSVEATGPQAEYIRYGMDYPKFMANAERVLAESEANLILMTTINALSYSTFKDSILAFLELRKKYQWRVGLSFNFLRNPECLDVRILPTELKASFNADLRQLMTHTLLNDFEVMAIERFIDYMMVEQDPFTKENNQKDLVLYARELDKRRGLDFPNTFPELHKLLPTV
jgi:pyruvate-formate lyase-activating enzyme